MNRVRRHYGIATRSECAGSAREKVVDGIYLALFGGLLFIMAIGWLGVGSFPVWWLLFA